MEAKTHLFLNPKNLQKACQTNPVYTNLQPFHNTPLK